MHLHRQGAGDKRCRSAILAVPARFKIVLAATACSCLARWRRAFLLVCAALGPVCLLSSRSRVRLAPGAPPAATLGSLAALRFGMNCLASARVRIRGVPGGLGAQREGAYVIGADHGKVTPVQRGNLG